MKQFIYITIISLILFSCKKETSQSSDSNISNDYLEKVKSCLKETFAKEFKTIDFSKTTLSIHPNDYYLQIAFAGKNPCNDFLLLKTDGLGNCIDGRIIHLEKDGKDPSIFNGSITIRKLDHAIVTTSRVSNGFLEKFHPEIFPGVRVNQNTEVNVLPGPPPPPTQTLPEVVVVGYLPPKSPGNVPSYSDYMSFQAVFNNGPASSNPSSGIYSPIAGGSGTTGSSLPKVLPINYETSVYKPGIDLAAWMKCFSTIPDAGAACTVTIFTDLPVNNDPSLFFNWYTGATGHSFLQLTKTNGNQSVTQIVGFTSQKPMQALFGNNAVPSKIVDNGGHKYNGYLTINITPAQLLSEINQIGFLASTMQYDIAKYNCVDFALQVVNTIRGVNPLIIPKYQIPGQSFSNSNTPEGLFKLFESMKAAGGPEAKNILTGAVLNAGTSKGACN